MIDIRHFADFAGRGLRLVTMMGTITFALSGCGGSATSPVNGSSAAPQTNVPPPQLSDPRSDANLSSAEIVSSAPGTSPFIEHVVVRLSTFTDLASVEFTIQPKAGSASSAVDVRYSLAALIARGYLAGDSGTVNLPIFGLYAGYTNQVKLLFHFQDGSTQTLVSSITTASYTDPTNVYQNPTILHQRAVGSPLGINFFYIKSALGAPVIVDTDGEIRWTVPGIGNSTSTALLGDEFIIGSIGGPVISRLRLDGTGDELSVNSASIVNFHHNIDHGRTGLLADVNTPSNLESTVTEITDQGAILNTWDLASVISAYMLSQGDDASTFVRPGSDWFHNNAAAYDPSDDSIVVSSRENFVIKLDYETGRIIWILGDPTKYWYTFPSLRAKALKLAPGGLYPIGQHAVSITADGQLMLFNDGLGSASQPTGAPAGESRSYSAVSAYSIDTSTMTAQNAWNFENGQTIYSSVCSSAYHGSQHSLLIDYATADDLTHADLVGLDSTHQVAFEFQYSNTACNTSWNAVPVPLENFGIDQ